MNIDLNDERRRPQWTALTAAVAGASCSTSTPLNFDHARYNH